VFLAGGISAQAVSVFGAVLVRRKVADLRSVCAFIALVWWLALLDSHQMKVSLNGAFIWFEWNEHYE